MGIEIVHDHNDFLSYCTPVSDFDMSPRFQWREKDEQIAGAIPLVLIVVLGQSTWFGWQWCAHFFRLLFAALVETNQRLFGIMRPMIKQFRLTQIL